MTQGKQEEWAEIAVIAECWLMGRVHSMERLDAVDSVDASLPFIACDLGR